MWDTFCIDIFCIHFVYSLYTKCIQKFVKMWDTFLHKAYIINIMYTIFMRNSYKIYI